MGKIYILPYLRKGLANNIVDPTEEKAGQKRAEIKVNLKMKGTPVAGKTEFPKDFYMDGKTIELLGPADVKSLSRKAISRKSPESTGEIRLNCDYRPYVEFYEEDLPWRYTPVSPRHKDFHSWMALIAVKDDEFKVVMKGSIKTVVLSLTEERYKEVFPASELLNAASHVQIDTTSDEFERKADEMSNEEFQKQVNDILNENPDCGISRILCTSKLEKSTAYTLLLIPAYELGRLSALDLDLSTAKLTTTAWADTLQEQQTRPEGMTFPVYTKWKIETASADANFITLANRLAHTSEKEYDDMKAYLDVDISHSGLGSVVVEEGTTIDVPASLTMNQDPTDLREEDHTYRNALKETLQLNPVFEENESGKINMESDPWIVPPVYGARHFLTTQDEFDKGVTSTDQEDGYHEYNIVNDVNLQLKNRIAAGMGSQIVKKNQEEFVNRAWKKVEVVNALNQLIREFYQMNEVNEHAKERSPRSTILKDKRLITKENIGLLSDAAMKMLQSSGIYYNNVAPDTMLREAVNLDTHENPVVRGGIPLTRLLQIYDKELWKDLQKKELTLQKLKTSKDIFNDPLFEDFYAFSFIKDYLDVKWEGETAKFTKKSDAKTFEVTNTHILANGTNEPCSTYASLVQQKKDNTLLLTELFDSLNELQQKPLALGSDNTVKKFGDIKVIAINLHTNLGTGYILPDNQYASLIKKIGLDDSQAGKPFCIEYWNGPCTVKMHLVFMSMTCFERFKATASYSLEVQTDKLETLHVNNNNGVFGLDSYDYKKGNLWLSILITFARNKDFSTDLLKEASFAKDACKEMRDVEGKFRFIKENPSTDKDYTCDKGKRIQLKRHDKTVDVSFKGSEHPWFRWDLDSPVTKTFFTLTSKQMEISYEPYMFRMNEILKYTEKFQELIQQPTHIEISNLTYADCKVITASEIVDRILADIDDDMLTTDDLLPAVEEERKKIETEFNANATPAGKQEEKHENIDSDIPDPDALAKERIEEICKKYGVTEINQLEDNLSSKYPVMVYPDFLDPTFFYLRELSVNYVLPGAGDLLKNSISCFYSNPKFEESLLMGMNTEMGHELLWREYPTDQRGSYFRKFWDQTNLPDKDELDKYYDVKPVHMWDKPLGHNHMEGKDQMLVFAIRGELMQAFPDTSVYLSENKKGQLSKNIIKATMASWLTEDTYLVGFMGIKKEELKNFFLVFEQMPMSLQFTEEKNGKIKDHFKIENPCIFAIPAGK